MVGDCLLRIQVEVKTAVWRCLSAQYAFHIHKSGIFSDYPGLCGVVIVYDLVILI